MGKFHVNKAGKTGACSATKGGCPFGGESDHYSTEAEARQSFEDSQGSQITTVSKTGITKAPSLKTLRESETAAIKAESDLRKVLERAVVAHRKGGTVPESLIREFNETVTKLSEARGTWRKNDSARRAADREKMLKTESSYERKLREKRESENSEKIRQREEKARIDSKIIKFSDDELPSEPSWDDLTEAAGNMHIAEEKANKAETEADAIALNADLEEKKVAYAQIVYIRDRHSSIKYRKESEPYRIADEKQAKLDQERQDRIRKSILEGTDEAAKAQLRYEDSVKAHDPLIRQQTETQKEFYRIMRNPSNFNESVEAFTKSQEAEKAIKKSQKNANKFYEEWQQLIK